VLDSFLILSLWSAGIGSIALMMAAATNRVVVFADIQDLLWSATPIVFPTVGIAILYSMLREKIGGVYYDAGRWHGTDNFLEALSNDHVAQGVLILAVIATGIGTYKIFSGSMRYNGVILGIAVALFKIVSGSILMLLLLGRIGEVVKESKSASARVAALVGFGFLLWLTSLLINGERVLDRRKLRDAGVRVQPRADGQLDHAATPNTPPSNIATQPIETAPRRVGAWKTIKNFLRVT